MTIENYATLKDIPIFKPGNHHSMQGEFSFSSEDLDEMVDGSNACQDIVGEAISSGSYRGNDFKLDSPIPSLLNIAHNKWLPETLKNLTKDVKAVFKRAGEWVTADLLNVPDEVALFIKERFPFRSVELIPSLIHPDTGKIFKNVIRSIAFLPPDIPPAVKGQSPDMAVEFQEPQGVITLFCDVSTQEKQEEPITQGVTTMATTKQKDDAVILPMPEEEIKNPQPIQDTKDNPNIAEFQQQIAQLKKENDEKIKHFQQENELLRQAISVECMKREQQEIEAYCQGLEARGYAPAVFTPDLKTALLRCNSHEMIEFSEDNKQNLREFWQGYLETILEMAAKGAIKVPLKEEASEAAGKQQIDVFTKQTELIRQFQSEGLEYGAAYRKAIDSNPALFND